ncbi:pimeloyl-ACP methyl ester carboxylesterase [Microbacterium keratanolyticum]|uniref:Esterase n=1 Tax=Microbacterium keratanolyticum TaxID=67574 RepID=A0A9W6M988_9MICO|nr:alpha/beta hydrolase [Microbacterium keratanolyticum]MBM7470254.1 pimeloyl-ACP methyl ester carboxylesterase [Microbacterium keratanolyticum]GLK02333.1 esterase [Microbacterium keratanolyticum]
MDIILVPGLWLDEDSWAEVTPALTQAGHRVHPLTMPGTGVAAPESAQIGIAEWVRAVTEKIDELRKPVVLVGHSGGGNVVWAAASERPEQVTHVIFVDTVPPADGHGINELPVVDGVVPFPGWDFFPAEEVADLDDRTRARTSAAAKSVPARVPTDPIVLSHEARYRIPVTLLMGSFDEQSLAEEIANWGPFAAEYDAIETSRVVRLDSGHWPQFSQPQNLATQIVDALR